MSDFGQPAPDRGGKKWRVSVVKNVNRQEGREAIDSYNAELAVVLRDKNVFRFRNFLAASGRALPDDMMLDTLKMATVMHHMILSLPELAEMHDFSRQWLDDNTILQSKRRSLNEAALRAPGASQEDDLPPPSQGSRTIILKVIPRNPN